MREVWTPEPFTSAVRGYHVFKTFLGHQSEKNFKFNNIMVKHAVKVVKGDETVGHLPCKFSRILWYFLARSGERSPEDSNKQLI